jgi:uncharacterized LabA/DUF88 family protein
MAIQNSTVIMIDGGYFDKVLSFAFNSARIDLKKLSNYLVKEEVLLRTYYYHCPPYLSQPPTEEELNRHSGKERFFSALRAIPKFEVRLGKLVYRGNDGTTRKPIFVQKLVDSMLSVDMVRLAATRQIGEVIIVAGDNDFVPAIEATKDLGVSITVVHGPPIEERDNIHSDLWNICDQRIQMSQEMVNATIRT